MAELAPSDNAPLEMRKWTRWVNKQVEKLSNNTEGVGNATSNNGMTVNATLNTLSQQIARITSVLNYLGGLTIQSAYAPHFNTGLHPGNAQFIPFTYPETDLAVTASTGQMIVTVGVGEASLDAGDTSAIAEASFEIRVAETGSVVWEWQWDMARLFLVDGQRIGSSIFVQAPVSVPADTPLIVSGIWSLWSSSTTNKASCQFTTPYISVEVIPAGPLMPV